MAKKNEVKLSAAIAKQLKNMGFNCKTEEDARKKLLAALEKEGVDGMEDEPLEVLIDMVDGFRDSVADDEEEIDEPEEEVDKDEQDAEDLADEVEAEDEASDDNDDEEEDDASESEEPDDDEEEEDDEEVEEKKPAKKAATKKTTTAQKKSSTSSKKTAVAKKPATKRGRKLDPKNNEDDRKELIAAFSKLFPEDTYTYAFVISGVSVKYIGKNSKRGVFLFDNLTRHDDGSITGNLYLNTMTKETDKLDELGIDYQLCWTKAPFIKAVNIEEANDILEKVFEIVTSFVNKVDKRLGDNRKKMEESLEKSSKKTTKTATKKADVKAKVEPDDDEEEEDDEEVEEKKPAKKAATKKTTKKSKK